MGFHLAARVYDFVKGTSPTAQAVLAYLAFRADDKGVAKCYPSLDRIVGETHFGRTAVRNALNELREANLLRWMQGGRLKGRKGHSLANEYELNLPLAPTPTRGREATPAGDARRPLHRPPDGPCRGREVAPIIPVHKENQTAVIPVAAAVDDIIREEERRHYESEAEKWEARRAKIEGETKEKVEEKRRVVVSVVDEAMKAAGVSDPANKRVFSSTILMRNHDACLEVIWRFASERRAGEYSGLTNPAAMLNRLLSDLPTVH